MQFEIKALATFTHTLHKQAKQKHSSKSKKEPLLKAICFLFVMKLQFICKTLQKNIYSRSVSLPPEASLRQVNGTLGNLVGLCRLLAYLELVI